MSQTVLSVNLNKIALLRNSRGRDFPSVLQFAKQTLELGVKGITIHPRPDERHIRRQDARDLAALISEYRDVELNIEGYPNDVFIDLVAQTKPHQVTLVPDNETQITSDHGWDLAADFTRLARACDKLRPHAGRLAVFVDPGAQLSALPGVCDRVELYTELYAQKFAAAKLQSHQSPAQLHTAEVELEQVLTLYNHTARMAQKLGLGVNAGHDLDLQNLAYFLKIEAVLEVSIGHALTVEALQLGWDKVLAKYLEICNSK